MKVRIVLTKTVEFPDDEAKLAEMGFEDASGDDPKEVARQQKEWLDDGSADIFEMMSGEHMHEDDGYVVQWWDDMLCDWRTIK